VEKYWFQITIDLENMNFEGILLTGGAQDDGGGMTSMLLMWGLIAVVFYFFMIRPQRKKAKEEREFRESLDKNVKVVTLGGMHGVITEVQETTVILKLEGGGKVKVEKSAVSLNNSVGLQETK